MSQFTRPLAHQQCNSCPFREGNDVEFGDFLRKIAGSESKSTSRDMIDDTLRFHRSMAERMTIGAHGNFACHLTAYDQAGGVTHEADWRQCYGAANFHERFIKVMSEAEGAAK